MRWLKFAISLLSTLLVCWLLSRPAGPVTFSPLRFLSPWEGFWQNGKSFADKGQQLSLKGLQAKGEVVYDENYIPHIFADNLEDAVFLQGYITASDRLWQMEFQTHVAAGRVSEVFGKGPGDAAITLDRENRKKGLLWAAQRTVEALKKDEETYKIMQAYTKGVNAYIESLCPADYPIEYKLLNYAPEAWSPLKTALLLKFMANNLTSRSEDIENTNALKLWGRETYNLLYPEHPFPQAPIIPEGTPFDFKNPLFSPEPAQKTPKPMKKKAAVSVDYIGEAVEKNTENNLAQTPAPLFNQALMSRPDKGIGSNNWAVSGQKTASGYPILCNDPHLGLNFPSIWYECQLSYGGKMVYGASLPGAPGIISGFNDSIAWGVTNAERDVFDFYAIKYKDASKNEYELNGKWLPTEKKIEEYKIKGGEILRDTVIYTHYGPVVYADTERGDLALRWTAHDPSLEAKTFLLLNQAHNYQDYEKAISFYDCPGQNFVFAAAAGDIAIWQQGKFPNKYKEQGLFVLDGADSAQAWRGFVPKEYNPHIVNPVRGYVGSANQAPTDASYPFWYPGGYFESFRNRRLNQRLDSMQNIKPEDMQQLQQDEYAVYAADILPLMLSELDSATSLKAEHKKIAQQLKKWDYFYRKDATEPSVFEVWWHYVSMGIWEDEFQKQQAKLLYPERAATILLLRDSVNFKFYDNINTTDKRENRRDILVQAFVQAYDSLQKVSKNPAEWVWYKQKQTRIQHLTRVLKAFGQYELAVGGNNNILNAIGKAWGPSWRMVVAFGKGGVEAYTVYPGGTSGNPGSPYYDNFVADWAEGKYHKAVIMRSPETGKGEALRRIKVSP